MRRDCFRKFKIVFVAAFVLFLQIGCQEQVRVTEKPEPELTAAKPVISPAETQAVVKRKEPGPEISFEQMIYDFGKIGPGTRKVGEFKFTNTGDSLLEIGKIEACCGGTAKLSKNKKKYAPGESGTVEVSYNSGRYPGPITKRLYVNSNDKARPRVTLTIKANIVPKVDYEPKTLKLLLKDENAGCPKITLRSLDNRPFAIKAFKSTADCITAKVDLEVQATKFTLEPKVNIEKLRKGLNGIINISLTHPECNLVTISFTALPRFKVNPPALIVFNAEPQKPTIRKVWILNNYDEDFEIESASSKNDIIKVLSQEKIGNRYNFELEITPPATEGKSRTFTDTFFVNIKGGEKLQIACRGFYSNK